MSSENELWASYFYPETYDAATMRGTLRNLFAERDAVVLGSIEYGVTSRRQRQLLSGDTAIPHTYDAEHVRAIHRHLFQDLYDWAGEFRTVNVFKGAPRGFADVQGGEIDRYLADVRELVVSTTWAGLGREEFAKRAAPFLPLTCPPRLTIFMRRGSWWPGAYPKPRRVTTRTTQRNREKMAP